MGKKDRGREGGEWEGETARVISLNFVKMGGGE